MHKKTAGDNGNALFGTGANNSVSESIEYEKKIVLRDVTTIQDSEAVS